MAQNSAGGQDLKNYFYATELDVKMHLHRASSIGKKSSLPKTTFKVVL